MVLQHDDAKVPRPLVLDLPAVPASAGVARGALAGLLLRRTDADARDTAALLLTELVTNAARHVGGLVHVQVEVDDVTLRIEVCDRSPRLPKLTGSPPWDSESGRGLVLVATLADRWGADVLPTGKRVWFELAVPGRPLEDRRPLPGR